MMLERCSGILLPISALPGRYGIGDFGKSAYQFVDFLAGAGQTLWQVLPLVPLGYGNSPYQSISVFAGNPLFIDLEEFIANGWLAKEELQTLMMLNNPRKVSYEFVNRERIKILEKIYKTFQKQGQSSEDEQNFLMFQNENEKWLHDYVLFLILKEKFQNKAWNKWPRKYKFRSKKALRDFSKKYSDQIQYHCFVQYLFDKQWKALKSYANKKGIRIFGDIPIYVAMDSADAWSKRELFQFTRYGKAKRVAGCPPDYFSKNGQLWGNILYDWSVLEHTNYQWWILRLRHSFRIFDLVRLDHFIGFSSYWSIPAGDMTAVYGRWEKGPGMKLFACVQKKLGQRDIVAEDLGILTDEVRKLLRDSKFPGMKVLQFAFDSYDSDYLPHKYPENCFAYTGTHDNDTLAGWLSKLSEQSRQNVASYVKQYLNEYSEQNSLPEQLIRAGLKSSANGVVIPMQDYLGVGTEGRFNTPSTVGDNWSWRVENEQLTKELMQYIGELTFRYQRENGRVNKIGERTTETPT